MVEVAVEMLPQREGATEAPSRHASRLPAMPVPRGKAAHLGVWIGDGVAFAYLAAGGYAYDARLAFGAPVSCNQLLGALFGVHLAWRVWRRRREVVRARATFTALAVLQCLLLVRGIGSANPEYARFKALSCLLALVPAVLYLETGVRHAADLRRLLTLPILLAAALLAASLPHLLQLGPGERLAALGGGPVVFARHLGSGILCALALGWCGRSPGAGGRLVLSGPLLSALGFVLAALAMLCAGSKAVLLATGIAALALLAGTRRRRARGAVAVSLGLLLAAPVFTHSLLQGQAKDGGLVRLLRAPDIHDRYGSYGSRLHDLRGSWEEFRQHPWFGVGTGAWGSPLGQGGEAAYPHNLELELLCELGLVGLLFVLGPLVRLPRPRLDTPAEWRSTGAAILVMAIFWTINVQFSGDLVDSRYLWWYLALLEIHGRIAPRAVAIPGAARPRISLDGGSPA